jgi:hypothetical protein
MTGALMNVFRLSLEVKLDWPGDTGAALDLCELVHYRLQEHNPTVNRGEADSCVIAITAQGADVVDAVCFAGGLALEATGGRQVRLLSAEALETAASNPVTEQ